jgi:serine protease
VTASRLRATIAATAALAVFAAVVPLRAAAADDPFPTDQIIVKYRDAAFARAAAVRTDAARTARVAAAAGMAAGYRRETINGSHVYKLARRVPHAEAVAIAARIAANADVEHAEPDTWVRAHLTPNDSLYPSQWHYFDAWGVNAPAAWDMTIGSYEVVAAVIDTGYRPHADLAGRILPGYDMIFDHLFANDGVPAQPPSCLPTSDPTVGPCINDRDADALDPGDWITGAEDFGIDPTGGYFAGCGASASSWHGTHVSGTIAAVTNNGSGVAGLNWRTKVLPVRVLGKCGGYESDVADAIVWAACGTVVGGAPGCAIATPTTGTQTPVPNNPNRARVLNLSLGGGGACGATFQAAFDTAFAMNAVAVVSAGNGNADSSGSTPANCNHVITVAAIGRQGQRATYSNHGSLVEIAAPGGSAADSTGTDRILSTLNSGTTIPAADNYVYYQGTSMAAPHVAGVVSLMLSKNPFLTPTQVLSLLQSTARPFAIGTVRDCTSDAGAVTATVKYCGAGVVDAAAALAAVPALPRAQLVADGTSVEHAYAGYPETAWYVLPVEPGKTYVVDVVDGNGDLAANAVGPIGVFEADGATAPAEVTLDCTNTIAPSATSAHPDARAPSIDVGDDGVRCIVRTFPPAAGSAQGKRALYIGVPRKDPAAGGGSTIAVRARESTIYGRWNTAGYDFHVELQNTTSDSLCAEIVRYPANGLVHSGLAWTTPIDARTLNVPAHGAAKTVYNQADAVNGQTDGVLRIGACAAAANLVAGALQTSTYGFDVPTGRYLYYFTSTANDGRSANSW